MSNNDILYFTQDPDYQAQSLLYTHLETIKTRFVGYYKDK